MLKFEQVINVVDKDYAKVQEMCNHLGISELTAKVLINRNIDDLDQASDFLDPSIENLHDPFLLKDMDRAVNRVLHAIEHKENVWIYGDYDVDGVTSTSTLMLFLGSLDLSLNYYIPDRMSEGYGLNNEAIDYIKEQGGDLIITVDCGITSYDAVEHCKEKGLDIIITDHHHCGEIIPDAIAVINPNRPDCNYPFKKLAGVGVAFKLVQAISMKLSHNINYAELLPIVATGTVADVVSLTGENRAIVKNGLELIKQSPNFGLRALISVTGLEDKEITSGHIGFVIGPRINAGGRIGLAKFGVELFLSKSTEEAKELAEKLDNENKKRQDIEKKILEEALDIIERDIDLDKEKVIVIASENWHHGVIGIVSSRITEKYSRPSILIAIEGEEGRGSARSVSSFDIYEGLSKCSDLFIKFGGHEQAAGLSIEKDYIPLLRKRINDIADKIMVDEDLIPQIKVDSEVDSSNISIKTIKELDLLQPFGIDNPSPQFLVSNVKVVGCKAIGKEGTHLKLSIELGGCQFDCIAFRKGHMIEKLQVGDNIDLIVSLEINDFMNNERVQLNVKEIIFSSSLAQELHKEYFESLSEALFRNINILDDSAIDKNNIITLTDYDRIEYILDTLEKDKGILVLINNYYNAIDLMSKIIRKGRRIIRNTSINFGSINYKKENSIVINPIINKIDLTNFDKIYIYDLFFDKAILYKLCNTDNTIMLFADNRDIKLNDMIIKDIVPSVEELRLVYKNFMSLGHNAIKVHLQDFSKHLNRVASVNITEYKLRIILEILNDCSLMKIKANNNYYYIKMCETPKEKIQIDNTMKFRYLIDLENNVENNFNYIKHI